MTKVVAFRLDREWQKEKPDLERGAILQVLDVSWDIDTQNHRVVFEQIGDPVANRKLKEVHYK